MFPIVAAALAGALTLLQPTPLPIEGSMIDLTNADRRQAGLSALTFDYDTLSIARARAADQAVGPLSHGPVGAPTFIRFLTEDHITTQHGLAGENLARWTFPSMPVDIERALIASPAHRANILDPKWTSMSVGVWEDATTPGPVTGGDLAFIFR